jgi:hypothetical protein
MATANAAAPSVRPHQWGALPLRTLRIAAPRLLPLRTLRIIAPTSPVSLQRHRPHHRNRCPAGRSIICQVTPLVGLRPAHDCDPEPQAPPSPKGQERRPGAAALAVAIKDAPDRRSPPVAIKDAPDHRSDVPSIPAAPSPSSPQPMPRWPQHHLPRRAAGGPASCS